MRQKVIWWKSIWKRKRWKKYPAGTWFAILSCHRKVVKYGLINAVAVATFFIFCLFTLYQGLKLIHTGVYPIPILPLLIAVTVIFAGLCVWLFTKRVKRVTKVWVYIISKNWNNKKDDKNYQLRVLIFTWKFSNIKEVSGD